MGKKEQFPFLFKKIGDDADRALIKPIWKFNIFYVRYYLSSEQGRTKF